MPIARFAMPDGRVARFEVPEGTTPEQAQQMMAAQMGGQGAAPAASPAAPAAAAAPAGPKPKGLSTLDKIKFGMMDPIHGGAQMLTNVLPKGLVEAGNQANNWLADKTGMVARLPAGGVDQQVREREAQYAGQRTAGGESGIDGYRLLGNVLSPANAALATRAPAAASLAGRIGVGVASGAASAAMAPVASGDFWSEKGQQVATGAATGGALPALGAGLARVVSPNASRNTNLQLLRKEGVTPTIGQALGGMAGRMEEKLQSVPIMGDAISGARNRANEQFQGAAFNRALKPIGEKLPAGQSGRDAIVYTENALRERYDSVLGKIGGVPIDNQFTTKVARLQYMVDRDVLSDTAKQKFQMVLNDMNGAFDEYGILTSEGFKRVESQLGADARKLGGSQDIYEGRLAPAVRQLQDELRGLLQRQAGDAADELKAVNTGWANFKRVQNAAGKLGAEDGGFSVAQFQNAVRALDKSKDKGAFARGSALGQDLGDAGRTVLTGKVPNSGTADRMWMGAGALGSGMVNPAIPISLLAGGAAYMSPAQRALVAAVASRPQAAQGAANSLRKVAPVAIPGFTQLGLQMRE